MKPQATTAVGVAVVAATLLLLGLILISDGLALHSMGHHTSRATGTVEGHGYRLMIPWLPVDHVSRTVRMDGEVWQETARVDRSAVEATSIGERRTYERVPEASVATYMGADSSAAALRYIATGAAFALIALVALGVAGRALLSWPSPETEGENYRAWQVNPPYSNRHGS